MNVLSLFDGMSCGQLALERAGIKVDNYYASEIDKHAINVTQYNYPNTIQLGDIRNWRKWCWDLPQIDSLMGGSPCQGFSFSGKVLNFDDPRSKLFFEYAEALRFIKPKYFLLENVRMKKESEDVITNMLGVEPIVINSGLVSAQNRVRLYWTNIPGIEQPNDKGIILDDILESDDRPEKRRGAAIRGRYDENKKVVQRLELRKDYKSNTLTTVQKDNVVAYEGTNEYRHYSITELERLQTLPEGYTNSVSDSQRRKMIGNGWTVDVISHILSYIPVEVNS